MSDIKEYIREVLKGGMSEDGHLTINLAEYNRLHKHFPTDCIEVQTELVTEVVRDEAVVGYRTCDHSGKSIQTLGSICKDCVPPPNKTTCVEFGEMTTTKHKRGGKYISCQVGDVDKMRGMPPPPPRYPKPPMTRMIQDGNPYTCRKCGSSLKRVFWLLKGCIHPECEDYYDKV